MISSRAFPFKGSSSGSSSDTESGSSSSSDGSSGSSDGACGQRHFVTVVLPGRFVGSGQACLMGVLTKLAVSRQLIDEYHRFLLNVFQA